MDPLDVGRYIFAAFLCQVTEGAKSQIDEFIVDRVKFAKGGNTYN
jgi:hypothetical protein